MADKKNRQAGIMLIASMVIWGSIGVFRKNVPVESSFLAMMRGLLGMAFLLGAAMLRQKRDSAVQPGGDGAAGQRKMRDGAAQPGRDGAAGQPAAGRRAELIYLVSDALIGINWILLFEAYRYTSVAVATLCYYMAPVFTVMASVPVLGEKLSRARLGCIALAFLGMLPVSGVLQGQPGAGGLKGVFFGLGAAVLYASVVLINKKTESGDALRKTILQMGSAGFVLLPYVLLSGAMPAERLSGSAVLLILFMGLVHTGLAYLMYFRALEQLPAQTVSVYSYIDPVVAIFCSAILLGEPMTPAAMLGSVLILGAAFLSERV